MKNLRHISICFFMLFTGSLLAQVSVGGKYSYIRSGSSDKFEFNKEALNSEGHHFALLFHIKLWKYFRIGIEPGITKKDFNFWESDIFNTVDFDFFAAPIETVNLIELPVHCSIRVPIVENKVELYSKLGFRADYNGNLDEFMFSNQDEHTLRNVVKQIDKDFSANDLEFKYSIGFGTSFQFGIHQIFIECEQFKRIDPNEPVIIFDKDIRSHKELKFGIGYLHAI